MKSFVVVSSESDALNQILEVYKEQQSRTSDSRLNELLWALGGHVPDLFPVQEENKEARDA